MSTEVLVLLRQMLQDPASGAARSLRSIATALAQSRDARGEPEFRVRFLGTTAIEALDPLSDSADFLRQMGLDPHVSSDPAGRVLQCDDHGVSCTLLETPGRIVRLKPAQEACLDRLLARIQAESPPQIVFTFGGSPPDNARRMRLRVAGAKVVFGLRNWGYLKAPLDFFGPAHGIDAVLAPSEFLLARYRERMPLPALSAALPSLLVPEDVLVSERVLPGAVVIVNPILDKGAMVFLRIADELARRRPDIPLLVVESRGNKESLGVIARDTGIDFARLPNITFLRHQSRPRDFLARTKILLLPSVWDEPASRLVGEALLNGIPPIVSDRGDPPTGCHGAGVTIPLPAYIQPGTLVPLAAADAEPWISAITRLWDSPEAYAEASAAARVAGGAFEPIIVREAYLDFFRSVRNS